MDRLRRLEGHLVEAFNEADFIQRDWLDNDSLELADTIEKCLEKVQRWIREIEEEEL